MLNWDEMNPLWLLLVIIAGAAHAAEPAYPNRPVRLLVPQPPGGSTDTMARMVGQKLTEL
jgi:tripartite-type tricarboxylate transporter receptor subunit TctC